MLHFELGYLQTIGYDLELTGFSDEEHEYLSYGNDDLEVYSDDPNDFSNMIHKEFNTDYAIISARRAKHQSVNLYRQVLMSSLAANCAVGKSPTIWLWTCQN